MHHFASRCLRAPRALDLNQNAQLSAGSRTITCHASHMNSRGPQWQRYRNLIKIGGGGERGENAYSVLIKWQAACSGFFMAIDAMFHGADRWVQCLASMSDGVCRRLHGAFRPTRRGAAGCAAA